MTYRNFTLDIDGDGIALVTWDMPGRSMNVIDLTVIEELAAIVDKVDERCGDQGRGRHLGQGHLFRRRRPHHAGEPQRDLRRHGAPAGRGSGDRQAVRGEPQAVAALSAPRDERQAVGRGDQRHRARRRVRALPRLPSPGRGRQPEDARRPARDQGRPVPRRRRHPARRPHDGAGRRAADAAQGRPAACRSRQGDEAGRRGRAGRRSRQGREGLDQGGRQGQGAVGRRRLQAAGRTGLFQGRHDGVPARQRDLSARDLRQLSGRPRDPAVRL